MLAALLLAAGGCARYEYDITAPPELAAHIGTDKWVTRAADPLEFRLITVDSHLVLQIHNVTDQPIQIQGDRSTLVDPQSQNHPLKTQTIAPQSFVKLILPPMPTRVERTGPSFGFGFGVGLGSAGYRRGALSPYALGYDDPVYTEPLYYAVYDPNDAMFWEWKGEGAVRLTIACERDGKPFTKELVVTRKRV